VSVRRIDSERRTIGVVTQRWRLRLSFLQSYFWLLSSFGTGRKSGNLVSWCKDLDAMLPVRLEVSCRHSCSQIHLLSTTTTTAADLTVSRAFVREFRLSIESPKFTMDYLDNPSLANTSGRSLSDKQNHSRNYAPPPNRHSSREYTSLGEEDISRNGSEGAKNPRAVSDVSSYLLDESLGSKKRYAEWGIHWFRNPLKLPLLTLCGTALAIGHHLTFASFNGKIVSESLYMSQTAVKQIGNVFVFLVLAAFKSVINDSYNQYIWMIVRRDSFKVQTLNKAFSLPTSPFSFFSLDLLQSAKLGFLLGIFSWYVLFIRSAAASFTWSVHITKRTNEIPCFKASGTSP